MADARPRRLIVVTVLAILLTTLLALPALASAPREPAAKPKPAPTGISKNPHDSGPYAVRTARGRIVMGMVDSQDAYQELGSTFGGTWVGVKVAPSRWPKYVNAMTRNWGSTEESYVQIRFLDMRELKKTNPELFAELTKDPTIDPNGFAIQLVGRNVPSYGSGTLTKLHIELILLQGLVKSKYVEAAVRAGVRSTDIDAALRRLNKRLSKIKGTNAYRDYLSKRLSIGNIAIGPTTLPDISFIMRQACGSAGRGSGCFVVSKGVTFAVPYGAQDEIDASRAMLMAGYSLHIADRLQEIMDEVAADPNNAELAAAAADAIKKYVEHLDSFAGAARKISEESGSDAFHANANSALTLIYNTIYAIELGFRARNLLGPAQTIHSALRKADDHAAPRQENMQQEAKNLRRRLAQQGMQKAENEALAPAKPPEQGKATPKTKPTSGNSGGPAACPAPGTGLGDPHRAPGGPKTVMAAFLDPKPCGDDEESGLVAGLVSDAPGGVDFSTLAMHYMSDDAGPAGVQFAFSGKPASPARIQNFDTGINAVTQSMADLRTWLALDPEKFWVNLNPDEPDRIIDPELGKTNAGRALLEADWAMKRTEGKLEDPNTELGKRYWDSLAGNCYTSRMWIVPGDVEVREDGDSLYILKAELDVKAQATNIRNTGKLSCVSDPASTAKNERLEQELMVPEIVKAVNTDPKYAPLRRAFMARIIAQWIRKRHQEGHRTSFDRLIDSGNLGPAVLDGDWRPKQVYDAYVHSIQNGEFTYTQTLHKDGSLFKRTMVVGGVDFSKLDTTPISAAQMKREHPKLPETAKASLKRPASTPDGVIWLGETAEGPKAGMLTRTTDTIRSFVTGRTGLLILVVGALGVLVFGMRGGTRRRRRTP